MNKTNKILALLLPALFVCLPLEAFAAGDIFTIISNKMVSTVLDVRKIVYVVAGFGLVMFSVLAIFNKISFKHLSYIMIGLFLLSVMMPFINYFSGANLRDSSYTYDDFISGQDSSITGSNVEQTEDCDGGVPCPGGTENGDGAGSSNAGSALDNELGESYGVSDNQGGTTGGSTNSTSNANASTGGENSGEKKSFKEKLKDLADTAEDIISAGKSAVNSVEYGMNVVDETKEGISDVGDIISGDGNIIDKIGDLAGSVKGSVDSITSNADQSLGSVANTVDSAGDVFGVSDASENSGVQDAVDTGKEANKDIRNETNDHANPVKNITGAIRTGQDLINRMGNWFD